MLRLEFVSTGKDTEVGIETSDGSLVEIGLPNGQMELACGDGITAVTKAYDDFTILLRVVPDPDQHVILAGAAVVWDDTEESWLEGLQAYDSGRYPWSCSALKLVLRLDLAEEPVTGAAETT